MPLPKSYGLALGWAAGGGQLTVVQPTLQALLLGTTAFTAGTAPGSVLSTITGKTAGSTISIAPSDTSGRFAVSGDGSQLLAGINFPATGASTPTVKLLETLGTATNSPRETDTGVTISAASVSNYLPGTPAAAWGVRRLVSGYNGFAARFTDTSNTRFIDIGFAAGSDSLDYATLAAWNTAQGGTLAFLFPTILYDQTGNGFHLTAVFSTNPVLQSIPSAKVGNDYPIRAAISYSTSGLTSQRNFVIPSGMSLNLTVGASFLVGSRPQSSIIRNVFFELNNGTSLFNVYQNTIAGGAGPNNTALGLTVNSGATLGASGAAGMPRTQPSCIALVQTGTTATIYADERSFTYGTASTMTTANGEYLGSSQVSATPSFMLNVYDILGAAAYSTALSAANVALAGLALSASPRTARKALIFDGDSITQGIFATYGESLSKLIETQGLNAPCDIWNIGVSGQQASNMNTNWAGRPGSLPTSNAAGAYTNTVYHHWAGTNDIQDATQTGAQAWSTTQAILTKAKAAGMKTVVGTLLYEGNSARNAERDNYNALVRAAVGQGLVDAVADYQADPTVGTLAATSNTTYYAPDKIHPTSAAYAILAPIGAAAINSVL